MRSFERWILQNPVVYHCFSWLKFLFWLGLLHFFLNPKRSFQLQKLVADPGQPRTSSFLINAHTTVRLRSWCHKPKQRREKKNTCENMRCWSGRVGNTKEKKYRSTLQNGVLCFEDFAVGYLIMFLHEITISWGITLFQKTFGQTDSDGECYTTGTSG